MNAKEMRVAAKCLLNMDCECECDSYYGYRCGKCNTLAPLARHILATVRDDDDESVSEEWVESIGGVYRDTRPDPMYDEYWFDEQIGFTNFNDLYWLCIEIDSVPIKKRGQFRRLCEGLGIQLKETT